MTKPLLDEVFLACDPATAFDLLADVRNESRWSKSVSATERRRSVGLEVDRPHRLVVTASSGGVDIDTAYTFAAVGGGTRVVVSIDVEPKGFVSVLSPLPIGSCGVRRRRSTRA